MNKLSKSALAKTLHKPVKVIDDWVNAGLPHGRTAGGHYAFDLAEVFAWREQRSTPKRPGVIDLDQERARLAKERANKIAFENELVRGNYFHVADVDKAWVEITTVVRTKILALPTKLAPVLAVEMDPAKCNEIIRSAIYDALDEIATSGDGV